MPALEPDGSARVLVVDDDPVVVTILRHGLAELGVEVLSAADGASGLRVLIDHLLDLDLLVVDLALPGLDGASVVRIVRAEGGERELPILVLATAIAERDRVLLTGLGVSGFLEKGVGSVRICEHVAALARRRRAACAAPPEPTRKVVPLAPIRLARVG